MASIAMKTLVVAAGVVSHLAYFNRGEHHMYGARYVQIFLASCMIAVIVIQSSDNSIRDAVLQTSSLAIFYLVGIYASLLVYRVLLSPLRAFPGPYGARISNFWFSMQLANHDAYKKVIKLHETYGNFVRIGSNDLSIRHPEAVNAIYGLGSKCRKADWYDLTQPMISMQTTRHEAIHDKRRRIWSKAFSDKALRDYQEKIQTYQDKLITRIASYDGQRVNITKYFNLYSFDVMGDLAFGASFQMLESDQEHWAIKLLNEGIEPLGYLFPTWFFRIMTAIPRLMDDWWKFIDFCSQKLDERMKLITTTPDIMSTLLGPYKDSKPTEKDMKMLRGDAQLIVVAGSDTTATTLTHIFYQLVRHPEHIVKLREEIAQHIGPSGDVDDQKLKYADHLNGVIHETLRLYPPVPTALQRLTPPEGLQIGDTHVPGNVTVWCSQYAMGRNEKAYTNASTFIPERWYSCPEMIKDRSAFAPFSAGRYGCIGRPLALLNVRTTVAKLLLAFDFNFALPLPLPSENGDENANVGLTVDPSFEATTSEHFTLAPGKLHLVFRKRQQVE